MKNPILYIKNVFLVLRYKLRFGSRIHIGLVQTFDRIRIEIGKEAEVSIGLFNQNREKLYIGVNKKGKLSIGNHCFFNINVSITCLENISIGDNCKFGNNVVLVDHDHNYRACGRYTPENPEFVSSPIQIGNNVWVGANVTILRGTVIGDDCVIGAGSTVKGIVPAYSKIIQGNMIPIKRENR